MPVTRDMLVDELQTLLRLTAFEQTIATIRRTQARTPALEQELAENAKKARERQGLLAQAVQKAGGVPDVVGAAAGRLGALTTAQFNQLQTLQGALLGDLTLEHALRERARYARTLAQTLGQNDVLPVLDRLETAHTATIEWLESRLGEVARTGTSLLRPTPVQVLAGLARKLVLAPLNATTGTVNQASALLAKIGSAVPQPLQDAVTTAAETGDRAVDSAVHVARLATQRAEDVAMAAGIGVEALIDEARQAVQESAVQVADAAGTVADRAGDAVEAGADRAQDAVQAVQETASDAAGAAAQTVSAAAGTAADAAGSAAGTVADTVSSAAGTVADAASSAAGTVADAAPTAADAAGPAAGATASAADSAGETVAELAEQAEQAAERLSEVDTTASGAVAHPFAGYEKLTGDRVMAHVRDTEDVEELRQILAFETANKARKGVLAAVQERLTRLDATV